MDKSLALLSLGPFTYEVAIVIWYGLKGTMHARGLGQSRHLAPSLTTQVGRSGRPRDR